MLKLKIGDVVKCDIENETKLGTITSYTVGLDGKKYTVETNSGTYENVTSKDIVSKWIEWKPRQRK